MSENPESSYSTCQTFLFVCGTWFGGASKQIYWFVVFFPPAIRCQEYSGEQSSQCPEKHGEQTYLHPEYCDQFYLCTNGTLTLEQCGNGLLYDGKGAAYHHCNYHWAVECGNRKAERTS